MGRSILAALFIGLLAWGGWALCGAVAGGHPGASKEPVAVGAEESGPPLGLESGTTAPPVVPSASPPQAAAAPTEAGRIRLLVASGSAREAVGLAKSLTGEVLRDPAVAGAAREAALSLADGPGAGPADRVLRADEARRLLGRLAVDGALPLAAVQERLDALNREVLLGGREVPGVLFRHVVKAGDTLDRLMKKDWKGRVGAGFGFVLWVNHIPSPDRLRVAPILVPEEPVRLRVRKKDHQLWVLVGEVPVKVLPVGLGMNGRTPEGTFEIEEMMPRPDYWPPGGKRIPFGQKGNPLGTRWIGFRDTPDAQGIGIHGTDDPDSIGKDMSQGCVRLRNADVEQLFTWVTVGTQVEVRP